MTIFGYTFGWKSITGAMSLFLLLTAVYSESIKIAWAFPAHRGYVQFTEAELRAYILKEVGELRQPINALVRNQLESERRTEEARKSEHLEKINRAEREAETTNNPRIRDLLKEQIAQSRENIERTNKEISTIVKKLEAIK